MWREDFEALGIAAPADGVQVVVAGGCDYYPGSRTASPSFSFAVADLRVAGEGDLLAQLEHLRRALHAEGLFEPQKRLARPLLPRAIGVVCGEHGKARDDIVAGLRRRGWGGRVVWAFAPVQDRHAAPAITRALQDLAACRGGRGDRRRPRRRLARRPVRVLRRDAVPHRGAAARAGDLVGRPPHRPHAARRRRRGVVLDADARGRGRRAARRARGARRPGRARRAAGAPGPAGDRGARPHAGAALARPGRAPRAPPHAPAPAAARAARQRPPARGRGLGRQPAGRGRRSRGRPDPPRWRGLAASCGRGPPRSPRTTPSARSSAATRSSRTARASPSPPPRSRREQLFLTLRLHDGRVPVRPEPPVP